MRALGSEYLRSCLWMNPNFYSDFYTFSNKIYSFRVFLYEKYLNSGDLTFFCGNQYQVSNFKSNDALVKLKKNYRNVVYISEQSENKSSSNQLTQTTYVRLQRANLKREGSEKWEKENFAAINLFVTSKKRNHEFTNSRI